MKRFIGLILIPILLMGLCACGKQKAPEGSMKEKESSAEAAAAAATKKDNNDVRQTAPQLHVLYEGQSCLVHSGTASWSYPVGDGIMRGYEADGFHPLDNKNLPVLTVREGAVLTLQFETDPDEIRVRCWNSRYQGDANSYEANYEVIEAAADGTIRVPDGGAYIFEVWAKWLPAGPSEKERASGNAYFAFMTSDPAEQAEPVSLWDDLDTDNSAIDLGWFDGTQGRFGFFAFASDIVELLKAAPAFPADDFTPDKLTYPVYGLACSNKNGHGVEYLWTNGYLLASDGSVYRFNYDFEALTKREFSFGEREVLRLVGIPGGWMVLKDAEGRWIPERMQPAAEGNPAEKVSLEVTGREGSTLQLELKNGTADCWTYGSYFSVETKLQGVWYNVPMATAEHVAFFLVAYPLEPGKSETLSCDLNWYGDLPAGLYRIVKSISLDTESAAGHEERQVYAEFRIDPK